MVEIGPGGGVLTRELLAAGARRVFGFELDPAWAFALRRQLRGTRSRWSSRTPSISSGRTCRRRRWLAGTFPQRRHGDPERLLPHGERVPRAAFLVQKEVAERIVAGGDPG